MADQGEFLAITRRINAWVARSEHYRERVIIWGREKKVYFSFLCAVLTLVFPCSVLPNESECQNVAIMCPLEIIQNASFDANVNAYNDVCFPSVFQPDENPRENKYIGFKLYKKGVLIYEFEKQERYIWSSSCNKIKSVSIKDLNGDGMTDVLIFGECFGAREPYAQPIIYFGLEKGFKTFSRLNLNVT